MHTRATTGNPQVSATHDNRNDQSDAAVSSGGVNSGCTIGPEVRWVREPVSHFRDLCCTHAPANFLDASRAHTPGQGLHDVARLRTLMRSGGELGTKTCLPAPGSTHKCEKNTIQIKMYWNFERIDPLPPKNVQSRGRSQRSDSCAYCKTVAGSLQCRDSLVES